MEPPSLAELIGAPCRVHGVRVGDVVAVLVDADVGRAIGLDVRAPDGAHRFLPWVAVERGEDGVRARSAYLLVDAGDSYVRLGARALHAAEDLAELGAEQDGTLYRIGAPVSIGDSAGMSLP